MTLWQWIITLWRPPTPPSPPITPPGPASDLLTIVNRERTLRNLAAFAEDAALASAAQKHATWMQASGLLTHGGDGTMETRAAFAGYRWTSLAENVAEGYPNPAEVVRGWMSSPGHRANLLGPYRHVGFGRAGNYWCANFGSPR